MNATTCHNCNERPALDVRPCGEPMCQPCIVAAYEHGGSYALATLAAVDPDMVAKLDRVDSVDDIEAVTVRAFGIDPKRWAIVRAAIVEVSEL